MRSGSAICTLLLFSCAFLTAADHKWEPGTWVTPAITDTYRIESTTETITAAPKAADGQRSLEATPGTAVQFAIEDRTVYVLDAQKHERALELRDRTPKYTTTYSALGGGHFIRQVAGDGSRVTLEDGSQWDIDPRVRFSVADWEADDLITIRRSTDEPTFAFEVDNTSKDDGALANLRAR